MYNTVESMYLDKIGKLVCLNTKTEFDYQNIRDLVEKQKSILKKKDVTNGAVVALTNNNQADFVLALFALWEMGCVAFPIDKNNKRLKQQDFLDKFNIEYIYTGTEVTSTAVTSKKSEEQYALYLLSSGTTGREKVIPFKLQTILDKANRIYQEYGRGFERTLCFLPTSFGHGLIANLLSPLLNGKTVYLISRIDIELALTLHKIIDNNGITCFSSVPSVWNILNSIRSRKPQNKSLIQVHCASEFLTEKTFYYMSDWVGDTEIILNYGLTECASWVTGGRLLGQNKKYHAGYIGKPFDCDITVSTTDSSEFLIKADYIPKRYIGTVPEQILSAQDNCLYTGDVGYIKEGHYYLQGRSSEFINIGGEKISPYEVEKIADSFQGVARSVAIARPDPILGEQLVLVLELEKEFKSDFDKKKFNKFINQQAGAGRTPKEVIILDMIPLTSSGKLSRLEIQNSLFKQNPFRRHKS